MELRVLAGRLAVCRLAEGAVPPVPPAKAAMWSLTRRQGETSLVCDEVEAPNDSTAEPGWRALEVAGVLDFSLVGVLAGLTAVLAAEGISVFVVSTYDTDVILVREESLGSAIAALERAGHLVVDAR
jgi:hypothetical protein